MHPRKRRVFGKPENNHSLHPNSEGLPASATFGHKQTFTDADKEAIHQALHDTLPSESSDSESDLGSRPESPKILDANIINLIETIDNAASNIYLAFAKNLQSDFEELPKRKHRQRADTLSEFDLFGKLWSTLQESREPVVREEHQANLQTLKQCKDSYEYKAKALANSYQEFTTTFANNYQQLSDRKKKLFELFFDVINYFYQNRIKLKELLQNGRDIIFTMDNYCTDPLGTVPDEYLTLENVLAKQTEFNLILRRTQKVIDSYVNLDKRIRQNMQQAQSLIQQKRALEAFIHSETQRFTSAQCALNQDYIKARNELNETQQSVQQLLKEPANHAIIKASMQNLCEKQYALNKIIHKIHFHNQDAIHHTTAKLNKSLSALELASRHNAINYTQMRDDVRCLKPINAHALQLAYEDLMQLIGTTGQALNLHKQFATTTEKRIGSVQYISVLIRTLNSMHKRSSALLLKTETGAKIARDLCKKQSPSGANEKWKELSNIFIQELERVAEGIHAYSDPASWDQLVNILNDDNGDGPRIRMLQHNSAGIDNALSQLFRSSPPADYHDDIYIGTASATFKKTDALGIQQTISAQFAAIQPALDTAINLHNCLLKPEETGINLNSPITFHAPDLGFARFAINTDDASDSMFKTTHLLEQANQQLESKKFFERHPILKKVLIGAGIGLTLVALATGIGFMSIGAALATTAIVTGIAAVTGKAHSELSNIPEKIAQDMALLPDNSTRQTIKALSENPSRNEIDEHRTGEEHCKKTLENFKRVCAANDTAIISAKQTEQKPATRPTNITPRHRR